MATPKIIADLETQLASSISVGATSFTLASATDDDGVALPAGKYYFTINNASTQKEYVVGTLSGTSVTSVSNVSRQGVETSGTARAHRIGSPVIMTDFLTYKNYIDETTTAGAPDASTITKGVVEAATLAEVRARTGTGATGALLVPTCDVLNDLPTQDEKAALAGGSTFGTPSSSNKYATEDFLATVLPKRTVYEVSGSPHTWTKPANLSYIEVELWGGGASGVAYRSAGGEDEGKGGGGGGAYRKITLKASDLGSTETITVGAGGAAVSATVNGTTNGNAGGDSSFGSHITAAGGGAPNNRSGGNGGAVSFDQGIGGLTTETASINSYFGGGGGGRGASSKASTAGGKSIFGGGGGGGCTDDNNPQIGGTSEYGGDGGAGGGSDSGSFTAISGSVPGGGGGAAHSLGGTATSGAGGNGRVIVVEYSS